MNEIYTTGTWTPYQSELKVVATADAGATEIEQPGVAVAAHESAT